MRHRIFEWEDEGNNFVSCLKRLYLFIKDIYIFIDGYFKIGALWYVSVQSDDLGSTIIGDEPSARRRAAGGRLGLCSRWLRGCSGRLSNGGHHLYYSGRDRNCFDPNDTGPAFGDG